MKVVLQCNLSTSLVNKAMHLLDFHVSTCLKPFRVMKYEVTVREGNLIFDLMIPSLSMVICHNPGFYESLGHLRALMP